MKRKKSSENFISLVDPDVSPIAKEIWRTVLQVNEGELSTEDGDARLNECYDRIDEIAAKAGAETIKRETCAETIQMVRDAGMTISEHINAFQKIVEGMTNV